MLTNRALRTLPQRVRSVLRKPDIDAPLYLPGVSPSQGFIPGNYIDSAGTQPAVYDQPVGLVLDAAGSVGAELVVNGDFARGYLGWYNNGGTGIVATGEMTVTGATSGHDVDQSLTLVSGKTYAVTGLITAGTTGGYLNVMRGAGGGYAGLGSSAIVASGTQQVRFVFVATGPDAIVTLRVSGAGNAKFDNISVKEVTGTHATQTTPGYKPTMRRGIVNLAIGNGTPSSAPFNTVNSAVTPNFAEAPDGSITASRLQILAANGALHQSRPELNNISFSQAVYVKSNTGSNQQCQYWNGTATISVTATTDWQLLASGPSLFATGARFDFGSANNGADLLIWRPGLFQGTLTAQQIIDSGGIPLTTTAPASSSAGNAYLEFKAANANSLQLGSVPFQMNEDHCVVVAARVDKLGGFNGLFVAGSSLSDFGPYMAIQGTAGSNPNCLRVQYKSTNINHTVPLVAGEVFVLTAWVVGGVIYARKNGVQFGTAAVPAYTETSAASIGSLGNGSGDYLDGAIYDLIPVKGTLSLADIQLLERFAAQRAGIQL